MKRTILFALAAILCAQPPAGMITAVYWATSGASPTYLGDGVNATGTFGLAINASGTIYQSWMMGDINSSGTVIARGKLNDSGHSVVSNGTQGSALIISGVTTVLGNLGGNGTLGIPYTSLGDINSSDYICGQSIASNGHQHAFIRSPGGTMTDLGTLDGATGTSWGTAINDNNWIAGTSTSSGVLHAVVWKADLSMVDLGPGTALGISKTTNQVVGIKFGSGDQGFSWTVGGGVVTLSTPSGRRSYAFAVNDSGVIAGGLL